MFRTLLAVLLSSTTVSLARPAWSTGALYTMTNDPSGNKIIVHSISPNGTVRYTGAVPTGGKGQHGDNGNPPAIDALFSQKPMLVFGKHLFAVNAGSNTVSMFSIDPLNPLNIRLVGEPVSSGGEYPVSIAASPAGNACVLNGGKVNGVLCYRIDPDDGLTPYDTFRPLDLPIATPPVGPPGTVSQVLFSPDDTKLRVSVKGTPPDHVGFVGTWDVAPDGVLSPTLVKSTPPLGDAGLPFGMINVIGNPDAVLATDPAVGMTIYDFSGPQPEYHPLVIKGQNATCWVDYSSVTDSYFLTDILTGNMFEVAVDLDTLESTLLKTYSFGLPNAPLDVVVGTVLGKQYLYVLSPQPTKFNVFSLKKGDTRLIQSYDFGKAATGVAMTGVNVVGAEVFIIGH